MTMVRAVDWLMRVRDVKALLCGDPSDSVPQPMQGSRRSAPGRVGRACGLVAIDGRSREVPVIDHSPGSHTAVHR